MVGRVKTVQFSCNLLLIPFLCCYESVLHLFSPSFFSAGKDWLFLSEKNEWTGDREVWKVAIDDVVAQS